MAMKITYNVTGLDYTADDWQLYAGEAGADECAKRLNTKFMSLVNEGLNAGDVEDAMEDFMEEAEQAQYGAADTEPRWHLQQLLKEVFKHEA